LTTWASPDRLARGVNVDVNTGHSTLIPSSLNDEKRVP